MKTALIASIYARVSTSRQEQEETIESQLAEIKKRISDDGNILSDENIFIDDGWTGSLLQRPALDAMRDAAMEGRFQALYVYDRGRISRIFTHQEIVLEELKDKEVQFISLRDINALTDEDRVLQAMQGVFAEYERVKIAERMRRGKLYKAKNGVLINGDAIYGYNYIKKTDAIPAHYEINEEQAKVVNDIFNWVGKERISLRNVIKRLYDLGIPPKKGKSIFWTKGPIVRMLRCDSYLNGIVYYNKSEAVVGKRLKNSDKYKKIKKNSRKPRPREEWLPFKIPNILYDPVLFERVQKILDYNQKYACKKRKYEYLLSGLVYCGCGYKRVGDGISKGNFYYRCAERIYKFPQQKHCDLKGINAVALDNSLWKELIKIITNPHLLKQSANEWLKAEVTSDVFEIKREKANTELGKIVEEELRYGKAYGLGTLDFDQFKTLMKDLKRRKHIYADQLRELNDKASEESIGEFSISEIIEEAKKVIASLDLVNKFKTIHDIITKVIVKGGQEVEVWAKIPLLTEKLGYEPISRDTNLAVPYLEFKFTFIAPKPRKDRIIIQRDEKGRIVHSRPPEVNL